MRSVVRSIIDTIAPLDQLEAEHRARALEWIDSGAGLFRVQKPATPDPHLVSYFVLVDCDGGQLLLVDHKNAGLWLPNGGHVELDEHPRATVVRKALEELGIEASFLFDEPLFVTVTETVGLSAGHTDVSLWYVLQAPCTERLAFDQDEFFNIDWFTPDDIPFERAEPHMRRFEQKLRLATATRAVRWGGPGM